MAWLVGDIGHQQWFDSGVALVQKSAIDLAARMMRTSELPHWCPNIAAIEHTLPQIA
jgi:hypothetical protein